MTKEELIINESYDKINGICIEKIYINLYSDKVNDSNKKKLLFLFAYYHSSLNFLLKELNHRILSSLYYTASDSRDLVGIINEMFELINNLENSIFDFKLNDLYFNYCKHILSFLQQSGGSKIPENTKLISIIKYEKIFTFVRDNNKYIDCTKETNDLFTKVVTRNVKFIEMEVDEKIAAINMALENCLKKGKKYINIDYSLMFKNLISEDNIKRYRNITHCFRHGSEEMIEERNQFNENEKIFLINYGITICDVINSFKKEVQF